jgi:hypothetical protein
MEPAHNTLPEGRIDRCRQRAASDVGKTLGGRVIGLLDVMPRELCCDPSRTVNSARRGPCVFIDRVMGLLVFTGRTDKFVQAGVNCFGLYLSPVRVGGNLHSEQRIGGLAAC